MGGTKVNYTPPPPDNTFTKYLEYQQEREKVLDARAEQERAEARAETAARKASGAASYSGLKTTTGTPAELEAQQQNVRDTRQYLYSAGLTNLQGEIDKETQSLKNEGTKQVAKIGAAGSLYSNLVSGFWG
jgi:tRNA A37 threonylcarbamoyltransferase TsaD